LKIKGKVTGILPDLMKSVYRSLKGCVCGIIYRGKSRYCPVCERYFRKFGDYGIDTRTDAICLSCGALERHRLTWVFLEKKTDLFESKNKKMLHVAPEYIFMKKFSRVLGDGYTTADLTSSRAMLRMDVSNIPFPDDYFDVIYCSHVLEHVFDDRKAIREFFRVLKEEGWAVLLVPVTLEETSEDVSDMEPRERLIRFGQEDHYRQYGRDFPERLREAGFEVKEIGPKEICNTKEIEIMGLTEHAGNIYFCIKGKR
jgi:SAM-dependent methyltransferase